MQVQFHWQRQDTAQPLYQQLIQYCQQEIAQGNWLVGQTLPAQRTLAKQLGVNRSTISLVYQHLQAAGLISGHRGGGTTIISNTWSLLMQQKNLNWADYVESGPFNANLPTIQTINRTEFSTPLRLSTGELAPGLLPKKLFQTALHQVSDQLTQLNYLPPQGDLNLRQQLAKELERWQIHATPTQILITSGSLQALQLISVSLLNQQATVYTENPTYLKSLEVFQSAGIQLVGLPLTGNGLAYWQLPETPAQQVLYTIPSFHNPTGQVMTLEQRQALLTFAQKRQLPIIEDTAYQDLWFTTPPPAPLKALDQTGAVIYLGTCSKNLAPGLRLGWVVASEPIIQRLADVKMQTDYGASSLSQSTYAAILAQPAYQAYLTGLRQQLAQRCQAALDALETYLTPYATWQAPTGGFYLWVKFDPRLNLTRLFQAAQQQGVLFNPGTVYSFRKSQAIRFSFAYAEPADFRRGIQILAQLIKAQF